MCSRTAACLLSVIGLFAVIMVISNSVKPSRLLRKLSVINGNKGLKAKEVSWYDLFINVHTVLEAL